MNTLRDTVSGDRLARYARIAEAALEKARESGESVTPEKLRKARADFLDMAERYIADARHFREQGDLVTAFAALNYAHGFLDAGARLGLFDVHDSRLFAQE